MPDKRRLVSVVIRTDPLKMDIAWLTVEVALSNEYKFRFLQFNLRQETPDPKQKKIKNYFHELKSKNRGNTYKNRPEIKKIQRRMDYRK